MTVRPSLLKRLHGRVRNTRPYALAKAVVNEVSSFDRTQWRMVSLRPAARPVGQVLLCYRLEPFLRRDREPIPVDHTNEWESHQIAQTFLDLGYAVDVIQWNSKYTPTKDYSIVVDSRMNLHRFAPLMGPSCLKIMHIEAAHWLFHNAALHRRYIDLRDRRGVLLPMRKVATPNWAIENADCATILGNEATRNTFEYAGKPLYSVPISSQTVYPWPADKDFDACRNQFIWLGGTGLVHKGLDRLLEAFAGMPQFKLFICGPVDSDPEFVNEYRRELFETPNITVIGWVDVCSERFVDLMNRSVALVYPSCSEGQCGSVINCLHAGVIPIVSDASGVDVADFGELLRTCSIDEIQEVVNRVAALPSCELERRSRAGWEYARANHTRERFAEAYRSAIREILS